MNAEFGRVKAIFLAAVEKQGQAERDAYLREACGQDLDLRRRVDGLLAKHAQAGSFLESPVEAPELVATPDEPRITERPDTVIGPYKLLEQIGEGGFGVVFMAEQTEPVRRKVALKVLKPGMDTRQVVARFEAERQALALMDHPNIAKVLDGGATENGRPYFVMDLVKGIPITDYCDQNHFTPRQRLELFIPVCRAVQHAHQKGLIHRDLKPSNILVATHDTTPVPKVIDFGVAKALGQELTDKTVFTGFAQMVGTPLYMSPEQAGQSSLDIDTRSDIYSLGVLLYELLTGTTPFNKERFKQAAYDEIRRIIREEEPPKPSTRLSESKDKLPSISAQRQTEPAKLTKLVRGELDWIVMKALEKDRNRRYETANGFAMDVQRYLNDEPVVAGPPSARYRLQKFLRRNRGPVLAAAMLGFAIVAGLVGVSWQWWEARSQRKVAEQERAHAEESLRGALETVDRFCKDVSEDVLLNEPGMQPLRRRLLERARDYYQKFIEQRGDHPGLRRELANSYLRLGQVVADIGSADEALDITRRAVTLFDQLAGDNPDEPDYADERAAGYDALGVLYRGAQRSQEAKTALETALAIEEDVARRHPDMAAYQNRLALILDSLGQLYSESNDIDEAEPAYERALRIWEQLAARAPAIPDYDRSRAMVQDHLAQLYRTLRRTKRQEEVLLGALALRKRLAQTQPTSTKNRADLASSHASLGRFYQEHKRTTDGETAFKQAIDAWSQLVAENPRMTRYQQGLADAHKALGFLYWRAGQYNDAEAADEKALEICERLVRDHPKHADFLAGAARCHVHLGVVYLHSDRPAESETQLAKALAILKPLVDDYPEVREFQDELAKVHNNLALVHRQNKRLDLARIELRAAIDIRELQVQKHKAVADYAEELARAYYNLALWHKDQDQFKEAEKLFRDSLAIWERLVREQPMRTELVTAVFRTRNNLAHLLRETGRWEEALAEYVPTEQALRQILRDDERNAGAMEGLRNVHWGRAQTLELLERWQEAVQEWDRTLEIEQRIQPMSYRNRVLLLRARARAHVGQHADAARDVLELANKPSLDGGDYLAAAKVFAAASAAVRRDTNLTGADREQQAEAHAARAVEMLKKAQGAGHFKITANIARMEKDTDLKLLRQREDFNKLVAELETSKQPEKK
jgi:serine/threonine protein kinase